MCNVCDAEDEPLPATYVDAGAKDVDKAACNALFVAACRAQRVGRVMVLDGPKGNTSKRLGLPPDAIHVPNAAASDAKRLARLKVCTVHRMRFSRLVRNKKPYDAIFYDACGSWPGSTQLGLDPREDARRIFAYGLRRRGTCVAAFTFNNCRRKRGRGSGDIEKELCVLAARNGWLVRKIKRVAYKNMRFWCMQLAFVC